MKSSLLKLILILLVLSPLPALDLDFRLRPFFFIPQGESAEFYDLGGGGDLLFDVDISSVFTNPLGIGYSLGLEGGILYGGLVSPASGDIQPYAAALGARLFYYPLSRLYLAAEGSLGLHQIVQHLANRGTGYDNGLWWRLGGEAGFRFNPSLVLSLSGGWKEFKGSGGVSLLTGMYAGLTAQFSFETRASKADVQAAVSQDEPVYPLLLSLYRNNPAGIISITNNETAEIRNVRVSFRAGNYTASEYPCGTIPLLPKNRSAELPLYADFAPALLNFTENGRIVGELVIRYTFLGKERAVVRNGAVQVYNRNRTAEDPAALAAFVSPTNPETLEAAKFFAGLARSKRRTGLNQNMESAVYLFEGLLAGDLWLRDNSDAAALNMVQFPAHTLTFRSGTAADLGLLLACLLEGMGIRAALIPQENDFITAFSLGIGVAAADSLFNDMSKLLVVNDEVWLPLSMAAFNRGFINSWEEAAEQLGRAFKAEENVEFIILGDTWGIYPPAPLPAQALQFIQPREDTVKQAAALALDQYVVNELAPKIAELDRQILSSPSALLYNRLGLLYLRSGRNAEAKAAFVQAADQGSLPALLNLGNLSLLESDLGAAEQYFNQILSREPENAAARRRLNSIAVERNQ
ncbi:hypothetical protein LQZ19_01090 [Treponema primitia]|uniref:tetratricopeptide repeat protein n=1 Tax=Treponema primitia TaxID=88058 RepID=UPI00397EA637